MTIIESLWQTFEEWRPSPPIASICTNINTGLFAFYNALANATLVTYNAISTNPICVSICSNQCIVDTCEAIKSNPTVMHLNSSVTYTYNSIWQRHPNAVPEGNAHAKRTIPRVVSLCWYFGILCGMTGMIYANSSVFPAKAKRIKRGFSTYQPRNLLYSEDSTLCCRRVEVVGLPGSGTNWLQYNLRANLDDISVTFKEEHGAPVPYESSPVWKHTYISQWHLLEDQTFLVDDTFFVVIVKNAESWIQSVARTPHDYTQVYTDATIWTSFTWTEIDSMDIVKLPADGGVFDVKDYDKPVLMRVSTTKSDRADAKDRLADRWVVFPNIVEAWNEFHRGWLEALSPVNLNNTKDDLMNYLAKEIRRQSPEGMQLPGPEAFHHPGGWQGVFISYEELLDNTEEVLSKLETVIRANVQPRNLGMTIEESLPPELSGQKQKWVMSGDYWILASHVPVISDEKFESLRVKPVGFSEEVHEKIIEMVSSISAQVEKMFLT